MTTLLEVSTSGGPGDLGLQHGRCAKELIRTVYATRMARARRGSSEEDVLISAMRYQRYVAKYAPELLEEVDGIALGAGISLDAAFFLQVATELELTAGNATNDMSEGCSSLGGTDPGAGPFIAQNWDQPLETLSTQIILRLQPLGGNEIMMFTRAGVIGYIGVSAAGVGLLINQLYSPGPEGLTAYFIARKLLGAGSVESAVSWLGDIEIGSAVNFLLGDAGGALVDLELGGGRFEQVLGPVQVHTNHYLLEGGCHCDQAGHALPDSYERYARLIGLFGEPGSFSAAMNALKDHRGYPTSVCRHEGGAGLSTVASVMIMLRTREMLVCEGNPCEGSLTPYRLEVA
jgi:isopenicillin-N N-acyltransferase like protein